MALSAAFAAAVAAEGAGTGGPPPAPPIAAVRAEAVAGGLAERVRGDAPPAARRQPNIVLMMTDNLGFGDLGSYGGGVLRGAPTPRLDELAREGLRLTNFNVEPECTPSRSALLTGRMPIRSGTSFVQPMGRHDGLVPCEYTLAELLSDAGYATALLGKWHLGSEQSRHPIAQGFDRWFGIPRSSDEAFWSLQPHYDPALVPQARILQGLRGENSTEVAVYDYGARARMDGNITDRAVELIGSYSQVARPFFLYVPFTLPHGPPAPHPDFADPRRSQYQNVLGDIDRNAGRILDAIDNAGIANSTIVVWTADNGPSTFEGKGADYGAQADSGPFRGEFPSAWEGAIRVPCIIRWPGRTEPGRVSNEIVSILDFYRTFAQVAGATDLVPTDRAIDSVDQSSFFFGQAPSGRSSVMWFLHGELLAMKWRNFKVHMIVRERPSGSVVETGQGTVGAFDVKLGNPWVFDVENDPKELWNSPIPNSWVFPLVGQVAAGYERSLEAFPNIPTGSDTCPWVSSRSTLHLANVPSSA